MSNLTNQMQTKMAQSLDHLRTQEMGRLKAAGDAIQKLPNINNSIDVVNSNASYSAMNNDDAAMIVIESLGVPGMDMVSEQVATTTIDFYGDRKATHQRPQDEKPMSLKEEARITREIAQQLKIFDEANRKINLLTSAMYCGDNFGSVCPSTGGIFTDFDPEFVPGDSESREYIPPQSWIPQIASGPATLSR